MIFAPLPLEQQTLVSLAKEQMNQSIRLCMNESMNKRLFFIQSILCKPIFHEVFQEVDSGQWSAMEVMRCLGDREFFPLAELEEEMCNLYLPFFQLMLIVIYDFRLDNFSLAPWMLLVVVVFF